MYPDYFEMIVHNYNKISTLIPNTEAVAQSCSVKKVFQKVFVKKFANFTGKQLCQSLFFNKVAATLLKQKKTLAQVFSCEFCEISMNTFS